MSSLKVIAMAGSLRKDSFNRKALEIAKHIAAAAGAEVEEVDLKTLNLPLYDQDIEDAGMPASVEAIRAKMAAADVLLLASPEYNYSVSGALKNAIDWLSTGDENVLDGKVAAIFGASTGPFGTLRGQFHLRQILGALNVWMVPQPQVFIRSAAQAFTPEGAFADPKVHAQLQNLIEKTFALAQKLKM